MGSRPGAEVPLLQELLAESISESPRVRETPILNSKSLRIIAIQPRDKLAGMHGHPILLIRLFLHKCRFKGNVSRCLIQRIIVAIYFLVFCSLLLGFWVNIGHFGVFKVLVPMKIVLACEEGTLPLYQQYQERILGQYPKILLERDRGTGEPHVHLSLLCERHTRAR
jgi:hypothetical protein